MQHVDDTIIIKIYFFFLYTLFFFFFLYTLFFFFFFVDLSLLFLVKYY